MMRLPKISFIGFSSLLLMACQPGGLLKLSDSDDRKIYSLEGSQLSLNRALEVGAEKARVFIQDGTARIGYNVSEYDTQCNFEVDSIAHQGLTIEPDIFLVRKVQLVLEPVVLKQPVKVAALSLAGMDVDSGGVSASFMGYHFWLDSPRQPQVRRMTCHGTYAEPADLRPPTLQEIRETLGSIARFQQ